MMTQPQWSRPVARISATGVAAALLCAQADTAAECVRYHVEAVVETDCGFGGFETPRPNSINNSGVSAGAMIACFFGPERTMIWDGGPTALVFPLPPGVLEAEATGITNVLGPFGQYVLSGNLNHNTMGHRAYMHDGKQHIQLPILLGHTQGFGEGINDQQHVVGLSTNNIIGPLRAVAWRNGRIEELVGGFTGPNQSAAATNNLGQVTGWMGQAAHLGTAFIWDRGKVIDLGPVPGCQSSRGVAISERGEVCGTGRIQVGSALRTHSFYYRDGVMAVIQPPPDHHSIVAYDVENGIVVGTLYPNQGGGRGFVWKNGVIIKINDYLDVTGVVVSNCWGINEHGVIIATGVYQGKVAGLRLTPIPSRQGDLNCDWTVGIDDLQVLLGGWGVCGNTCIADLNRDGVVNAPDLGILLGNWG